MAFQTGLYFGVAWIAAVGVFLYRRPVHVDIPDERPRGEDDDQRHDPVG